MKHITEAIKQYLDIPKTNYALQIEGPWGTGKTHYLLNEAKPVIEAVNSHNNVPWKICYVSLNGVSKVEDIAEAVFFEMAGDKSQMALQAIKMAEKYGDAVTSLFGGPDNLIGNMASKWKEKKIEKTSTIGIENIILCFDDLERIDNPLSIKQVLGFINTNYIEHYNVKVIFLSNDKEIAVENYKKIKEKVIGRTLRFERNPKEVIDSICIEIYGENELFMEFYNAEKDNVFNLISTMFRDINLRTFRFILDTFVVLQKEAFNLCDTPEEKIFISKTLFLNILIIGIEYKSGNIEDINQLKNIHNTSLVFALSEDEKTKEFKSKYYRLNNYIDKNVNYFEGVSKYIITGYIDKEIYITELKTYIADKFRVKNNKANPLEVLKYFYSCEDKELEEAYNVVINLVGNNEYLPTELVTVYKVLKFLERKDIGLVKEGDINYLLEKFEESLLIWEPLYQEDIWSLKFEESNEVVLTLLKKINNKINENRKTIDLKKVSKWLNLISSGKNDLELLRTTHSEKRLLEFFVELDIVEMISTAKNDFIFEVRGVIYDYVKGNNLEFNPTEANYIEPILNGLKELIDNDNSIKGVKKYNINLMIEELEKVKKEVPAE